MKISETGYGVDVAVRRMDDLDRAVLARVEQIGAGALVLELGAGAGGFAARLEAAGAEVTAVDQYDFTSSYISLNTVRFVQSDLRDTDSYITATYDVVVCQRTLHYVPYEDAVKLLRALKASGVPELYFSLSGLDSDLGKYYEASEAPIAKRYGPLTPEGQETFGIQNSLCLYRAAEARNLIETGGYSVERLWESAFGNIKVHARFA